MVSERDKITVNPSKITRNDAQAIWDDHQEEAQGSVIIEGEEFWWWTDGRDYVWFYANRNDDGEDTIKRFTVDHDLREDTSY